MSKVDLSGHSALFDARRFRRLGALLGPRLCRRLFIVLAINFVAAVLEMGGLGLLPAFITVLSGPQKVLADVRFAPTLSAIGVTSVHSLVIFACVALAAYYAAKTLYTIFALGTQARYMKRVMVHIGKLVFERYIYAPYAFHINAKSAEIINNVAYAPQYLGVAVILPILQIFLYSLMVGGTIILLLIYSPVVALAALVLPALASAGLLFFMRRRSEYHGRALSDSLARMITEVNHALGSIKEVHLRGSQSEFLRSFGDDIETLGRSFQFQKSGPNSAKPVIEFFGIISLVIVTLFFVARGEPLAAALPTLVLFVAATARMVPNLHQVTANLASLRTYAGLIDRICEDLEAVRQAHANQQKLKLPGAHKLIVQAEATAPMRASRKSLRLVKSLDIESISYSYPGTTEPALKNVSLKIPAKSVVAFVGPSGSGKSTLVDVILGLIQVTEGALRADGVDLYSN